MNLRRIFCHPSGCEVYHDPHAKQFRVDLPGRRGAYHVNADEIGTLIDVLRAAKTAQDFYDAINRPRGVRVEQGANDG